MNPDSSPFEEPTYENVERGIGFVDRWHERRAAWIVDEHVTAGVAEHRGGVNWYDAGIEFRARPWWKRLSHRHRAQTRVSYPDGAYLERCICGAYGLRGLFGIAWSKRL